MPNRFIPDQAVRNPRKLTDRELMGLREKLSFDPGKHFESNINRMCRTYLKDSLRLNYSITTSLLLDKIRAMKESAETASSALRRTFPVDENDIKEYSGQLNKYKSAKNKVLNQPDPLALALITEDYLDHIAASYMEQHHWAIISEKIPFLPVNAAYLLRDYLKEKDAQFSSMPFPLVDTTRSLLNVFCDVLAFADGELSESLKKKSSKGHPGDPHFDRLVVSISGMLQKSGNIARTGNEILFFILNLCDILGSILRESEAINYKFAVFNLGKEALRKRLERAWAAAEQTAEAPTSPGR